MNPRILFLFSLMAMIFSLGLVSCKKAVDNAQQNAMFDVITNGKWTVSRFIVDGNAKTSEYAGYEFQFFRNSVVTAIKDLTPQANGTWSLQTENATITSSFPGQDNPLKRFNAIWLITSASETTVQATTTVNGEVYLLGLLKK